MEIQIVVITAILYDKYNKLEKRFQFIKMSFTYNEKRSLYEMIMDNLSETVKNQLRERQIDRLFSAENILNEDDLFFDRHV